MKKMTGILVAIVAATTIANAGIVTWESYGELSTLDPGSDLFSYTGKGAAVGSYIAIYQATAVRDTASGWFNTLTFDQATGAELTFGDALVHSSAVTDDGGWLWISESVTLGVGNYYTVLFDAADIASSSEAIVLESSTFAMNVAEALPAGTLKPFNLIGDAGVDQLAWQAIPEPATLGLMGIAGLGMFLARKKARR